MLHPASARSRTHARPSGPLAALGLSAMLIGLAAAAHGRQDAGSTPPGGSGGESGIRERVDVSVGSAVSSPAIEETTGFPLIREGSRLTEVLGVVDRDPRTRSLRLTIDESDPQSPGHRLVFLPSSRLTELQLVIGANQNAPTPMIVTGRVFVYEGVNYLMLTHPPVPDATMLPPSTAETVATPRRSAATPDGEVEVRMDEESDSVDAISFGLERSIGEAGRRRATENAFADAMSAALLLPEGTRIVDRRGTIIRTSFGGFSIVFDADASGDSDPPMMLLPCSLLSRLGEFAGTSGRSEPVLITGEVT
ncbi:MAG: hypothetical protein ACYTEV_06665, partial [Planctomycetota bacterium]